MKFKLIISNIFLILLISGCTTIECEEFDLDRQIMHWHFFPELLNEYTYNNGNSETMVFKQIEFKQSEFQERQCNMCACGQYLKVSYENQIEELLFSNVTNYDTELFPDWIGGMNYIINDVEAFLTMENGELIEQISELAGDQKVFALTRIGNVILNGINYDKVTQIEIIESQSEIVSKFWIQESIGLVAFEIHNEIWTQE